MDLKIEVDPQIFTQKPDGGHGYRLVLDIYPTKTVGQSIAMQPQSLRTEQTAESTSAKLPAPAPEIAPSGAVASVQDASKEIKPAAEVTAVPKESKPETEAVAVEEIWLAVRLNRQPSETTLFLRRAGRLLVRDGDLHRWRIRLPEVTPVSYGGEIYYPLDALRGLSYQVDETSQTLALDAAPGLFEATALRTPAGFNKPTPAPPGGFLNYDVFANHAKGKSRAYGLVELGGFGIWGAGVGSFLVRDLGDDARFIRLDTTLIRDLPDELASLRLGDAISGAGSWGRSVRFGGVQWATNFATQPSFITFPLPGMSGEAALPSTVDLYVNDALRMRREVPAGPFSIQDLPVVSGRGEARLVVRDLLGREQVIIHPYYASARLLQQGLHDYSYELGLIRENYGVASNEYGRLMATGTHRFGLNDRLTGEVRGELLRDQQTAGAGVAWIWPDAGIFTASFAGSRSGLGTGGLLGAGFERQARRLNFGGSIQVATERFTQLGLQPGLPAPRQLSQAFISHSIANFGSASLSYTHQVFRDREEVELVSANYGRSLGKLGYLNLSLLHFLGGSAKTILGLTFTSSLGERTSASVSATMQQDSNQAQLQVQRNLPAGSGMGYRLRAGAGDSDLRELGVSLQNDVGTYNLEAARSQGGAVFRGGLSGGLALLGGNAFLSRRISDSFAVVRVPDFPNVRIYADNQPVATTDNAGNALVPRLRPYQKNSIRIEQADLPLDAQIDGIQIDAVPYFRSGLLLQFPVRRSLGALLTIILDSGEPMPSGALVQIVGEEEEFPVGLRGEVYLVGLSPTNRLRVTWRGQSCELTVIFPETTEPVPHLGTYACTGVKL